MSEDQAPLNLGLETERDVIVIRPEGEIHLENSPALRNQLSQIAAGRPARVVFDLSAVTHLDSSGVGTLVEFKRNLAGNGGEMVLAGLQPAVRGMFELTKLDQFFAIARNVSEARNRPRASEGPRSARALPGGAFTGKG